MRGLKRHSNNRRVHGESIVSLGAELLGFFKRLVDFSLFNLTKTKTKSQDCFSEMTISGDSQIESPIKLEACLYCTRGVNTM